MTNTTGRVEPVEASLVECIRVTVGRAVVLGAAERVRSTRMVPLHVARSVRGAAGGPLLAQLRLSDRLRYARVSSNVVRAEHASRGSEELLGRHHHLVVASTARSLALVDQIEQVRLVLSVLDSSRAAGRAYAVVGVAGRIGSVVSVLPMVDRIVVIVLRRAKAHVGVVASIALSELDHKVSVEHRLPHIRIIAVRGVLRIIVIEAASPRLVEVLRVVPAGPDVRQHLVDA